MSANADKQVGKCACGAIVERPRGAGRFATLLDAQPFVCKSCKEAGPTSWSWDPVIPGSAWGRLHTGASFGLDAPDRVPAVWGTGSEVPWSEGESLVVAGPQGVGKSTIKQQLALRRAGVVDGDLLGFPVTQDSRLVLYLALDRPQQIARSLRRMITPSQRELLERRMVVWKGPLTFDLVKSPERLLEFVEEIGKELAPIGTVFIDSIKDIASPLSSDEVGAAVNRAIGGLVANGIEVCAGHHQRKATSENRKPTQLADVYGSVWITAGAGSVVLLWGEAGDPVVELTHLKQPAEEIGPFEVIHDHTSGTSVRRDRADAWTLLQEATHGITATVAAEMLYGSKATRAQVEKVRRKFERFVENGQATRVDPGQKFVEVVYMRVTGRDSSRDEARDGHASSRNPENNGHAPVTHSDRQVPLSKIGGDRAGAHEGEGEDERSSRERLADRLKAGLR